MKTNNGDNTFNLSRFVIPVSLIWFFFCAVVFSNAGSNTLALIVAIYIGAIWGAIWFIRLIASLAQQRSSKNKKRTLLYWLLEPAVIIVPLMLSFLGVFSFIRFTLSQQALSSYVENVRTGKINLSFESENTALRQVGLYTVKYTDLLPDGTVRFKTSSHGLLDEAGFANTPHHPPPNKGEDSYKHIYYDWWYWYESW